MSAQLPAGFLLRPATRADGPEVTAVVFSVLEEYGLRGDPHDTDRDLSDIEQTYFRAGGCFDVLIETAPQRIVGSIGLLPLAEGGCELRKMYLLPAVRGRGLGKFLLTHALAEARRLGFRRVVLETADVLKEAVQLYRSFGFQPGTKAHVASRCDLVLEKWL